MSRPEALVRGSSRGVGERDDHARRRAQREAHLESVSRSELARPMFAEFVGAFVLTAVDAGSAMVSRLAPSAVSEPARSAAAGLTIMALTYALAEISGAHFNPAITMAFAARRVFPWLRVPLYVAAQLCGATLAALALRAVLGPVAHVGATEPGERGPYVALATEALLTFVLVMVAQGTAHRHKIVGPHSGLATGGTVALCGLAFRPLSGASMNPARSFGSALVGGQMSVYGVYVAGPLIGAAVAVIAMHVLHPTPRGWEAEAAGGKAAQESQKGENEEPR